MLGVLLLALIYMRYIEPSRLRVERVTLTRTGLPAMTVAVVADLHHGLGAVDDDKVREVVRVTNALHADVIVLLGDYHADGAGVRDVTPEQTAELLAPLRARLGVYAVLGNHDHWSDPHGTERALTSVGITVLENRGQTLPGSAVWLAGLSDDFSGLANPREALRGAPPDAPVLAITHSPDVFPKLPRRFALTLAAHTHGGQMRLPVVGSPWIPESLSTPYVRGVFEERGHRLYVSSGIGMSVLPFRFGVVPEVNLVTIR